MKALQQEGKFKFPSEEKLQAPSSCDHMHMMHTSHAHSSGKYDMHACTQKHARLCGGHYTARAHYHREFVDSLLQARTCTYRYVHVHVHVMCVCELSLLSRASLSESLPSTTSHRRTTNGPSTSELAPTPPMCIYTCPSKLVLKPPVISL